MQSFPSVPCSTDWVLFGVCPSRGSVRGLCLRMEQCWPQPATMGTSGSGRYTLKGYRTSHGRHLLSHVTLKYECGLFFCLTYSARNCACGFSHHLCVFLSSPLSRCLHELRPHGGRPLSCLLFCDNHKRQDPESVPTGAHTQLPVKIVTDI